MSMAKVMVSDAVLTEVDRYVARVREELRLPGLAVTVVSDGQIVLARGYGSAAPGRVVSVDTPFLLGSLSKAFTAVAVMQLAEVQKLDLDASITTYLPWFAFADGRGSTITLRHLLMHTSGITRRIGRDLLAHRRDRGLEQTIRDLRSVSLPRSPGERFEYSNMNYSVLALVVEVVSGTPFDEYIAQHVYAPLAMHQSFVSEEAACAGGLAAGFRWWFGWPLRFHAPYLFDAQGAAFLIASARDMGAWLLFHLGDAGMAGVLSREGLDTLHAPGLPTRKGTRTAMGWRVGEIAGVSALLHGGEVSNYRGDVVLFPDRGQGVVVLANANNGAVAALGLDQIGQNVARLLLGEEPRRPRFSLRKFGFAALCAALLAAALSVGSFCVLWGASGPLFLACGVFFILVALGGLWALWRLPRAFDMGWRGLLLYVPDLASVILALAGFSWLGVLSFLFRLW